MRYCTSHGDCSCLSRFCLGECSSCAIGSLALAAPTVPTSMYGMTCREVTQSGPDIHVRGSLSELHLPGHMTAETVPIRTRLWDTTTAERSPHGQDECRSARHIFRWPTT